jgi:hypothetical protein
MTIRSVHARPDWYIASHKKNGKYHFGIASTRLAALDECLASIIKDLYKTK